MPEPQSAITGSLGYSRPTTYASKGRRVKGTAYENIAGYKKKNRVGSYADTYGNMPINAVTGKTEPAAGTAEYVPIEAMLLPGTPAIKGLGNIGNFIVDVLNPIAGMGKRPGLNKFYNPIKEKIPNIYYNKIVTHDFRKGLSDEELVKGYLNKFVGKNVNAQKEAVDVGNKWSKDWWNAETTQKRIDYKIKEETQNYDNLIKTITKKRDANLPLTREETKLYFRSLVGSKPESFWGGIKRNIKDEKYLSKLGDETSIFDFEHAGSYNPLTKEAIVNRSINLEGTSSTAIHEGTHGVTDAEKLLANEVDNLKSPFKTNVSSKEDIELTDATEIYSRISQIRQETGLRPGQVVDDIFIDKIIKDGLANKSSVSSRFYQLITKPKELKRLFNTLPSIVTTTGSATAGATYLMSRKKKTSEKFYDPNLQ